MRITFLTSDASFGSRLRKPRETRTRLRATIASFAQGRAMAYYEVVSLMHQQATAFGLPFADVGLQGINPDRDLL
jgi:hypothetical protein